MNILAAIGVIGVLLFGSYWLLSGGNKSDYQKYSECRRNAGEIAANLNGYTTSEQAYYYQQTEKGYNFDLETCQQLYNR